MPSSPHASPHFTAAVIHSPPSHSTPAPCNIVSDMGPPPLPPARSTPPRHESHGLPPHPHNNNNANTHHHIHHHNNINGHSNFINNSSSLRGDGFLLEEEEQEEDGLIGDRSLDSHSLPLQSDSASALSSSLLSSATELTSFDDNRGLLGAEIEQYRPRSADPALGVEPLQLICPSCGRAAGEGSEKSFHTHVAKCFISHALGRKSPGVHSPMHKGSTGGPVKKARSRAASAACTTAQAAAAASAIANGNHANGNGHANGNSHQPSTPESHGYHPYSNGNGVTNTLRSLRKAVEGLELHQRISIMEAFHKLSRAATVEQEKLQQQAAQFQSQAPLNYGISSPAARRMRSATNSPSPKHSPMEDKMCKDILSLLYSPRIVPGVGGTPSTPAPSSAASLRIAFNSFPSPLAIPQPLLPHNNDESMEHFHLESSQLSNEVKSVSLDPFDSTSPLAQHTNDLIVSSFGAGSALIHPNPSSSPFQFGKEFVSHLHAGSTNDTHSSCSTSSQQTSPDHQIAELAEPLKWHANGNGETNEEWQTHDNGQVQIMQ